MSAPARAEMELISKKRVFGLGKLEIDAWVYDDILDMLQLAWTRRGGAFEKVIPWLQLPLDEGAECQVNRDWIFDYGPP